jgi:superfamily I DNA/RNA helicase
VCRTLFVLDSGAPLVYARLPPQEGFPMAYPVILDSLNPPQRAAVLHKDGPLLVLAGAGSGKTRVIIYRIAHLIAQGVPATKILGVTFTNKAARQMRQRLTDLIGARARGVTLSTFHALGLSILQAEWQAAGLRPGFCIYDTSDQLSLLRELMRQVKVADRRLDAARVLDLVLSAKRKRLKEVPLQWGDDYEMAAFDLYPKYLQQMQAFNAIDFDDLLLRCYDVLQIPEVRARWAARFDYLLVDEYQDTSPDQLELVRALAGERQNVCAVGDDDQAIYAWRGAAVDNILGFARHFPGTQEVVLTQNYRSTGGILAAANHVIANNQARKPKQLWSAEGEGDPVEIVQCKDGEDEAEFVVEQIMQLHYKGVDYRDIAVLYRANAQSRIFEENLALERVPFRVIGGQAFFDRKEVRDAMAFLAVCHNPSDEVALRRIVNVPPRGIGPVALGKIAAVGETTLDASGRPLGLWKALTQAAEVPGLAPAAVAGAQQLAGLLGTAAKRLRAAKPTEAAPLVHDLFAALHIRDAVLAADDAPSIAARRLENLDEAVASLKRFEQRLPADAQPLAEFMRASALVRQKDDDDARAPSEVTLMTLHSAKGLEFPYVFLVGVEEEILPHRRILDEGGSLSEERRLCYVGITRARRRLILTYAQQRTRHGRHQPCTPSRFLQEIPEGPQVVRYSRSEPVSREDHATAAAEFFAKMRQQFGD